MSNPPPFNHMQDMMGMRMNGGPVLNHMEQSKTQAPPQDLSPNSQVFSGNRSQTYNHAVPMNPNNNNNNSNSLNNLNINNQNFNHPFNNNHQQNLNPNNNQFGSNYNN